MRKFIREAAPALGALALVLSFAVFVGCGHKPGTQRVYQMKCYSGERLVLDARVIKFQPLAGSKAVGTMWDVDNLVYLPIDNMACTFTLTGELR